MSCLYSLLKGVQSSCNALKKVGGLDARVWLGSVDDLASVTFGAAGVNSVTAITFKASTGLVQYIGKADKNNAQTEIEVGENVNLRNQSVTILVGIDDATQEGTLDALVDTEEVFAIVETRAGQLEVYGLNRTNFDSFGLKMSALTEVTGTLLNDSTLTSFTLSGGMTNLKHFYNPGTALATNVAALDALTIDPAPAP